MKTYDVCCPICGALNHNLYLEETDGWMECEHCGQTVQILTAGKMIQLPVYTGKELAEKFAAAVR